MRNAANQHMILMFCSVRFGVHLIKEHHFLANKFHRCWLAVRYVPTVTHMSREFNSRRSVALQSSSGSVDFCKEFVVIATFIFKEQKNIQLNHESCDKKKSNFRNNFGNFLSLFYSAEAVRKTFCGLKRRKS